MNIDRSDRRFFDFMCSCGEEGESRCDATYEEVKGELKTTDLEFATAVVHALQWTKRGSAVIEGIYADMWCGISVKYHYGYQEGLLCEDSQGKRVRECRCDEDPDYDCEWRGKQEFWIECDRIHHGLARAYQLVKQFEDGLANE